MTNYHYTKELSINSDYKESSSPTSSLYSKEANDTHNSSDQQVQDKEKLQSPTARFFGAIKDKVLRSRSPSPARPSPTRSTTPRPPTPPADKSATQTRDKMTNKNQRTVSMYSTSSATSTGSSSSDVQPKRSSTSGSSQSDFEKMTYGRHSSEWIFGSFSVRDTLKNVVGGSSSGNKKRDSRHN